MNNTKTIVCHSGAISLGPGFSCRSLAAGVVAIFVFLNPFANQNNSCLAVAMRELRSAGLESYAAAHVRAGSGCVLLQHQGRSGTAATKPFALRERLRHEDEVARQFRLNLLGEGCRAGFDVA